MNSQTHGVNRGRYKQKEAKFGSFI